MGVDERVEAVKEAIGAVERALRELGCWILWPDEDCDVWWNADASEQLRQVSVVVALLGTVVQVRRALATLPLEEAPERARRLRGRVVRMTENVLTALESLTPHAFLGQYIRETTADEVALVRPLQTAVAQARDALAALRASKTELFQARRSA
jgi:hypothetical protein